MGYLKRNFREGLVFWRLLGGQKFLGFSLSQLARDLAYGKRGKVSAKDIQEQKNTCSCMTLILANIIYWQAKEI